MRLSIFVGLMLAATLAVGIGSYMAEAAGWTIFLRMVVVLVALQLGYFVLILITAYLAPTPHSETQAEEAQPRKDATPVPASDPVTRPREN